MSTITQAIAKAGREKGPEDGTRIEAALVASNVSAKLTVLKFLPEDALPAEFVRDIRGYRTHSAAFKINIACERLPQYTSFDPAACGFAYPTCTHIGPTIEYLERAYGDAKWGAWSGDPSSPP